MILKDLSEHAALEICEKTAKIEQIYFKNTPLLVEKPSDYQLLNLDYNEKRVFTINDAWGADECWPTIGAIAGTDLLDHGSLWSSPAEKAGAQSLWVQGENSFQRTIHPTQNGFGFTISYPKSYVFGESILESLYAYHALFAAEEGDVLEIYRGKTQLFTRRFPEKGKKEAEKLFFSHNNISAILKCKSRHCQIHVSSQSFPHLGIWWCNNAWGDGRKHQCIGIEPTSHAEDGPILGERTNEQVQHSFAIEISEAT